jgi:hypothetical protein
MGLVLHRGSRVVERPELDLVEPPPPTETWYPLKHAQVLDRVVTNLDDAGFAVRRQTLALSADNHRFFATLDLITQIGDGIALTIGLRSSTDKSLPLGWICGERVFVCDNLAFASEVEVVRKHTRNGEVRFNDAISKAVQSLHQYSGVATRRIAWMRDTALDEDRANSLILQAYEKDIVGDRLLRQLIREWREPQHEEFKPRSMWSLFNAFTEVLKVRQRSQPARAAAETIQLQSLLTHGMNFALAT